MQETEPQVVASCPNPRCNAPIREDHSYSWCSKCGESLPDAIQQQVPKLREIDAKGQAVREAMRPAEIDAGCSECGARFRGRPALTFLGFQKLKCPNCSQVVLLPLKKGYLITYWVILGFMVIGAINAISKGGIPFPGLLGIAVLIGVVKDIQLRRKLAAGDAGRSPK